MDGMHRMPTADVSALLLGDEDLLFPYGEEGEPPLPPEGEDPSEEPFELGGEERPPVEGEGDWEAGDPSLSDTVRAYLTEIGSYPLLTLEEEVGLARRIWEGQEAAQRIGELLGIPQEEILRAARLRMEGHRDPEAVALEERIRRSPEGKRLYLRVRDGEQARKEMVLSNLRLVVSVAKRFVRRAHGLHILDLIQEGNRGLIRATYTFDWRKGHKFSTYATWWIRQAVTRAVADQGRTVRLPVHMHETLTKVRAVVSRLRNEGTKAPTAEEVARALGEGWSPKRVEEVLRLGADVYSLDEPVTEDGELYGYFVADERVPGPEETAMGASLREQLERALGHLTEREALVIRLRYGLLDGREHTLEEVGHFLEVSRERVRQIENKALRRLKYRVPGFAALREYLP